MKNYLTLIVVALGLTVSLIGAAAQAQLSVEFQSTTNFKQADIDKLNLAKKLMELVLNSADFKSKVLNFTYQGKKEFVQNNGMTNEQIYDYMMLGAEKYPKQTEEDHQMDFKLELYTPRWNQSKNVIGYTSQSDEYIHLNRSFYSRFEIEEIAMNLTHEWTHKIGFDHDYKSTARRPYSVPYAIGYLVRDISRKLLK